MLAIAAKQTTHSQNYVAAILASIAITGISLYMMNSCIRCRPKHNTAWHAGTGKILQVSYEANIISTMYTIQPCVHLTHHLEHRALMHEIIDYITLNNHTLLHVSARYNVASYMMTCISITLIYSV